MTYYCGTSGFSYDDWAGVYYPPGLPRNSWLNHYAAEFNALELNTTYYALPPVSTMESLIRRTGDSFLFAVKANQEMTHKRQQGEGLFQAFLKSIAPIANSRKLGCILAQFPYSFGLNVENRNYLDKFHAWLRQYPLVFEFRNSAWLDPVILDWLKERNIGFCCVDEPQLPRLLPPVAEVTADIGYVRFHGRNEAKWRNGQQPWERYDYTYTAAELAEWIPKIVQIGRKADRTFIFANNHWKSQAVNTIRQVQSMLDAFVL
jgi:uncharacterized protein YecE (DUF72 family)